MTAGWQEYWEVGREREREREREKSVLEVASLYSQYAIRFQQRERCSATSELEVFIQTFIKISSASLELKKIALLHSIIYATVEVKLGSRD